MKLKPCPFCGSENLFFDIWTQYPLLPHIECLDCLACGPGDTETHIGKWNERVEL